MLVVFWPHGGLDAVLRRWSVVKADPDDGWAYQSNSYELFSRASPASRGDLNNFGRDIVCMNDSASCVQGGRTVAYAPFPLQTVSPVLILVQDWERCSLHRPQS